MRTDQDRLQDMLRAIDAILAREPSTSQSLAENELERVWVLYHLQVIGEAASRLTRGFRSQHPDPDWANAIGLRNILVHHYFAIDPQKIFAVIKYNLRPLRAKIANLLTPP